MYVTYTRIYGWSDYGGESSYQPGYRLENMMWMTLLVYDYIIPGEKFMERKEFLMDNITELSERICDCISDGYDDEEWREDAVDKNDGCPGKIALMKI